MRAPRSRPRGLWSSPTYLAFRYPVFRRVWAAGLVSQLGDWMQIVGRSFLAYELTGKAESVGIVYFASYAPQLIFSLWGGVLADRFDRRKLLIATQVAQLVGAIVFGVMVSTGAADIVTISALSFFLGIAFMLAIPAQQALTPAVVPREGLTSAISLGTATNSIARVIGPLLASLLIGAFGLEWVFWLNAVTFLAVIGAWVVTPVPRHAPMAETRSLDAMRTAIRYVRDTPSVKVVIGSTAFLMLVGIVYQPLAVVYATEVLADGSSSLGQSYYGWLQAGIGLGAALGILAFAGIGRRRPAATFAGTALAFSAALAVLGLVQQVVVAFVVIFVVGAFHFANIAVALNVVQHEVPDALRGRVMAIQMTGLVGVVPITALLGGLAADAWGIGPTMTAAGLICFVFSLFLLRWVYAITAHDYPQEAPETQVAIATLIEEEA